MSSRGQTAAADKGQNKAPAKCSELCQLLVGFCHGGPGACRQVHDTYYSWAPCPQRQPTSQNCANFIWAVASLGHDLADKGLIDAVCQHFATLIKHHGAQRRPYAQESANVMWALASVVHEPADMSLIDAMCDHFARLVRHCDDSKQRNAQEAANLLWALASLGLQPVNKGSIDALCGHFVTLIAHHAESKRPMAPVLTLCLPGP